MASEEMLKELFQISKTSPQFKGMSDDDIWNACLSYKDRPDEDIKTAMDNIQEKDRAAEAKAQERQEKLEQSKEKRAALQEKEADDREQDSQKAEEILKEFGGA